MAYDLGSGISTVDSAKGNVQIRQEYYNKKAIIETKDEMILGQMSDSMSQPKHMGKEVVRHRYIPLLDDENAGGTGMGLDTIGATYDHGNLYGSSRSMGVINGRLPSLDEDSKTANKVSFSRKEVRGHIVNHGFYFEWTKDEVNFDSDPDYKQHITTEAVRGAAQINEDILAIELINGAGINYFAGDTLVIQRDDEEGPSYIAPSPATLSAINQTSLPTLRDLIRLDTELDNNKCPKDTTVIAGSRLIDTKTVAAARYMFISPDMKMDFMQIEALDSTPTNPKMAFVPVEQYADGNGNGKYVKSIHGEIGKVGPFRIVVHPKMVKYGLQAGSTTDSLAVGATWNAADVDADGNTVGDLFRNDGTNYEVYPNLVVGSGCFTHIGFEYGAGTKGKFNVVTKTPEQLRTLNNPYAKTGMTVVEFWNGVLVNRPDHLAVYNTSSRY